MKIHFLIQLTINTPLKERRAVDHYNRPIYKEFLVYFNHLEFPPSVLIM